MADKTTTELERIYTIPLRKTKDLVRSRRADLAVRDVKRFLTRHMKSDQIWLDNEVNEMLWSQGKFRIPSRIRVRATRFSDGVVEVTLPEAAHEGSVRSELAERREKAAEAPVLKGPKAEEEGEEEDEHGAPLTDIEGIGDATAEKLAKADIESIEDLAEADAEALSKKTGFAVEKVAPWIAEAKKVAKPRPKPAEPAGEPGEAPAEGGKEGPGATEGGKEAGKAAPAEPKATESKPAEPKATESKPAAPKPAEPKPAKPDAKPEGKDDAGKKA